MRRLRELTGTSMGLRRDLDAAHLKSHITRKNPMTDIQKSKQDRDHVSTPEGPEAGCENPFGNIFELYSHSYELTHSAGAYQD